MAVSCKDPASLRPRFVTGHAVLKLLTCASPPDMSSKFSLPHLVLRRLEQLRKELFPRLLSKHYGVLLHKQWFKMKSGSGWI